MECYTTAHAVQSLQQQLMIWLFPSFLFPDHRDIDDGHDMKAENGHGFFPDNTWESMDDVTQDDVLGPFLEPGVICVHLLLVNVLLHFFNRL